MDTNWDPCRRAACTTLLMVGHRALRAPLVVAQVSLRPAVVVGRGRRPSRPVAASRQSAAIPSVSSSAPAGPMPLQDGSWRGMHRPLRHLDGHDAEGIARGDSPAELIGRARAKQSLWTSRPTWSLLLCMVWLFVGIHSMNQNASPVRSGDVLADRPTRATRERNERQPHRLLQPSTHPMAAAHQP